MRSRSRKLVVGIGSFVLAASLVAPSFAAKKVISDAELDNVTAAGEPTIISTSGDFSGVTFTASTVASLALSGTSQNALRALVLNNIVGENQIANALNVSQNSSGTQANSITQSWGSIFDITAATVAGISAAGTSGCNAAGAVGVQCIGVNKSGNASTSPGLIRVLSRTADVIISTAAETSPVTYNPTSVYSLSASDSSQSDLVALIVNNVTGLNQVANAVNISAFGTVLSTGSITLGSGGGGAIGGQVNTINQFRGTPANWTR